MPLCLAAGALVTSLLAGSLTLSWQHSIEKILWEEDWRLDGQSLVIQEARVRGTGAGMEPPVGAQLRDGAWHYVPQLAPLPAVRLTHSPYVEPYTICVKGDCRRIDEWLQGLPAYAVVELLPCTSLTERSNGVPGVP